MRERKTSKSTHSGLRERLRQVAWAGLIALALTVTGLLIPADKVLRVWQYSLASFDASGEIAFIGAQDDLTDANFPRRREELANLITELDRVGTREIYVDLTFDRPTGAKEDNALHEALKSTRGHAVLVQNLTTGLNGTDALKSSIPEIGDGIDTVGANVWTDFIGFVWYMPYSVETQSKRLPSLSARIAGKTKIDSGKFPVSYFFSLSSIPTYRYDELLGDPARLEELAGKTVIIGAIDPSDVTKPNLPGLPSVSPSLIHIFAAETLKAGQTSELGGLSVLLALLALLVTAALLPVRRLRYIAYAAVCLGLPITFYVTAQMAMRMSTAGAIMLLLIYAAFRARAVWKQSFRLIDEDTKLPTFAALEIDKDVAETVPAIIVAKIHRFEEVRRTLPQEMHAEYVLRIIARLQAATQDATIYLGSGHLIAWTTPEKEPPLLKDHLEGLRALFASPLLVGENQVDVGITFGVDITPSPNVTRRIAAAVSAAEHTNETFEPIAIADTASDEDLIWNISIQARIDAALANGEIFLVYQPKINVVSGELIGVEALVRWRDPVKGHIPPDHFIRQCENAGRMSHLTRHVLTEGCEAGLAFIERGTPVPVAVNISATLLHERSIVRMVREVLSETGFDPRLLVLEITETYRISNLELAAEILTELKSLGTKISMDDFGVGAASMEALLCLPFSELKIDRLFTSLMITDSKALGIVRNVLALGKDLGITVVAEGVEDDQTLNLLRDSGCLVAQGFGISRPVSFDEVVKFQELVGTKHAEDGLHFTNKVG